MPHLKVSKGRGKKIFVDSGHMEADDLHMMDGEGEEIDVDGDISDDSRRRFNRDKGPGFPFHAQCYPRIVHGSPASPRQVTDLHAQAKSTTPRTLLFFVIMCRCDTDEADALCGKCTNQEPGTSSTHVTSVTFQTWRPVIIERGTR